MAELSPIPIPWRQRWREFRVDYLPMLTFAALMMAIGILWSRYVHPAIVVGEVEAVRVPVVSTVAGTVETVQVGLLQSVTNGQLLAVVSSADTRSLQAGLTAIEADLRLIQARMAVERSRESDGRRRLRLDLMNERINLSLAQVRLRQVESEFDRVKRLFDQDLTPRGLNLAGQGNDGRFDYGYDVALRDRDGLRAEITERTKLVADLEKSLAATPEGTNLSDSATAFDGVVENAIRAQQSALRQQHQPLDLRACIDGFVSAVHVRAGERVMAGTPLLTLSAKHNERVIAWVRPPIGSRPKVGDPVKVRRVDVGRAATTGTIIEVGGQLEPLSASLQPRANNNSSGRLEVGLPILVRLDDARDLIPGEPVQVEFTPRLSTASH